MDDTRWEDVLQELAALRSEVADLRADRQLGASAHEDVPQDVAWKLLTSTFVFLMQLGFAMIEAGMSRQVNVIATYAKNILDFAFGSIAALVFGYQIAYGVDALNFEVGDSRMSLWFNYIVFSATSATIVSGAMAERTAVLGYSALSVLTSGIVFPLAVRLTWGGGYLSQLEPPFQDFAGAGVVHVVGGCGALLGSAVIGARSGRWDPHKNGDFVPSDAKSMLGGVLILWVGWYGFNQGSTSGMSKEEDVAQASNAALATTISGSAGGIAAIIFSRLRSQWMVWRRGVRDSSHTEVDIIYLTNGVLSGLVAITAACNEVSPWGALIVGVVAGLIYPLFSHIVENLLRVDDIVDAAAVHLGSGAWGLVAVGLLDNEEGLLATGNYVLLRSQLIGFIVLVLISTTVVLPFALLLNRMGWLRVSIEEEARGLDSKFGIAGHVHDSAKVLRLKEASTIIHSYGFEISDLVAALHHLKAHIVMPFSPHASDNLIEGQVRDILERIDYNFVEEMVADAELRTPQPKGRSQSFCVGPNALPILALHEKITYAAFLSQRVV